MMLAPHCGVQRCCNITLCCSRRTTNKNKVLSDTRSCRHNKLSLKRSCKNLSLTHMVALSDTSHPVFLHPLSLYFSSISLSCPSFSAPLAQNISRLSLPRHFSPPSPSPTPIALTWNLLQVFQFFCVFFHVIVCSDSLCLLSLDAAAPKRACLRLHLAQLPGHSNRMQPALYP